MLLRGDHALHEQKLADATGAQQLRPATPEEVRERARRLAGQPRRGRRRELPVLADAALRGRRDMVTGANQDDFHLRGVDVERDLRRDRLARPARGARAARAAPPAARRSRVRKTIEVGHIFKLGTRYSETLGATRARTATARRCPLVMGSYGIGIGRTMAAVAERCHDEHGLVWPMSVAPYEVVVCVLNPNDPRTSEVGARLYEALRAAGVDALLDDRDERPGVKFKDAELIGIPYRLTVGPKGLEQGKVEIVRRRGGARREVDVAKAADHADRERPRGAALSIRFRARERRERLECAAPKKEGVMEILSMEGWYFLLRWFHFLAGHHLDRHPLLLQPRADALPRQRPRRPGAQPGDPRPAAARPCGGSAGARCSPSRPACSSS